MLVKIDFLQVMQLQKIETAGRTEDVGFDVGAQYSDATLTILSSKNNPVLEVRFRDLYPTSLSGLSYDQQAGDTSYLTGDVSFSYNIYEFATVEVLQLLKLPHKT